MTARKLLVFVFVMAIAALAMEDRVIGQPSVCPAWLDCPSANCRIYCHGSYCVSDMAYIMCDGVITSCPWGGSCSPPTTCLDPCGYCECISQGGSRCLRSYCYEWEGPKPDEPQVP